MAMSEVATDLDATTGSDATTDSEAAANSEPLVTSNSIDDLKANIAKLQWDLV